jgi:type VII secretion effector (TIGR04197 family)
LSGDALSLSSAFSHLAAGASGLALLAAYTVELNNVAGGIANGLNVIYSDFVTVNSYANALSAVASACSQSALVSQFENSVVPPIVDFLEQIFTKASDMAELGYQNSIATDLASLQSVVNSMEAIAFSKLSCFAISSMYVNVDSINSVFSAALSVYAATYSSPPTVPVSCQGKWGPNTG